jgi:hypothetical protein
MSFAQERLKEASLMKIKALAVGQGIFYMASGLWPIIHYKSFEKVTGPKTDDWLVKTVGGLIAAGGLSLLYAGLKKNSSREAAVIGAGHAFVLGTSSGYYSSIGRIAKIYMLDSATEYGLVGAWLFAAKSEGLFQASSYTQQIAS